MSTYQPGHSAASALIPFDGVNVIIGGSITVTKIPLLEPHPRHKPETESQRALTSLLQKRRLYYEARRRGPSCGSSHSVSFISDNSTECQSGNTTGSMADNELSYEEEAPLLAGRTAIAANSKHLCPRKKTVKPVSKNVANKTNSSSSNLIDFDSKELAERIVNRARQRMRGKMEKSLTTYMKPIRTSTPIPGSVAKSANIYHPKGSPIKSVKTLHPIMASKNYTKIKLLGNKNNSVSTESSSTASSPDTSTSDSSKEQSQETVKKALHPLTNYLKLTLKLRAAEEQAKLAQEARERSLRRKKEEDRKAQRIAALKLKAQQRAEIYALNEVMAKLEKEQFEAATAVKI